MLNTNGGKLFTVFFATAYDKLEKSRIYGRPGQSSWAPAGTQRPVMSGPPAAPQPQAVRSQ
jgi:hypothetical protein